MCAHANDAIWFLLVSYGNNHSGLVGFANLKARVLPLWLAWIKAFLHNVCEEVDDVRAVEMEEERFEIKRSFHTFVSLAKRTILRLRHRKKKKARRWKAKLDLKLTKELGKDCVCPALPTSCSQKKMAYVGCYCHRIKPRGNETVKWTISPHEQHTISSGQRGVWGGESVFYAEPVYSHPFPSTVRMRTTWYTRLSHVSYISLSKSVVLC